MNKSDYKDKYNLLSDNNTYKVIKRHKTLLGKMQKATSNILNAWNEKGYLCKKYRKHELSQTNTSWAKFYGLPKLHKEGIPLRPIISIKNSPIE